MKSPTSDTPHNTDHKCLLRAGAQTYVGPMTGVAPLAGDSYFAGARMTHIEKVEARLASSVLHGGRGHKP